MSRILPIVAFCIALAIFFGYVNPAWTGSIATTQAAINADNQGLAAANDYTARQNQLASARNAIDPASLAALTTLLPDSVNNVRLILDLDALAARSGLSLTSIDVATSPSSTSSDTSSASVNPVGSVDLSLSATGSYAALKTFLEGVESSARLLDVTDLTVTGSDTGVYSYKMNVRLYWLR
jgi:Tfp pilus assembly protein PilO